MHQFAESLGNAVDARDSATFNHSWEVAELSRMIAEAMGLSAMQVETVHVAGHLHDIGKIGTPDTVLKKQGKLSEEEWDLMKRHPDVGAVIIRPIEAFAPAGGVADMVLHHHERFDGKGYPEGLRGREIPLGARIIAVADTLSAMLQNRPYRCGTSFRAAMTEVRRCAGSQFDPAVVAALCRVEQQVLAFIREKGIGSGRSPERNVCAAKAAEVAMAGGLQGSHGALASPVT